MFVDTNTMFEACAIVLLVIASAFYAAWMRQRDATYWLSWIVANVLLAASLISFMAVELGHGLVAGPLANVLLVAGFGMRWRAARQFSGRPAFWLLPVMAPTVGLAALFALPRVLSYASVYCACNATMAVLAAAIIFEFWRDRADGLTSRYGILASYGLIGFGFTLRGLQGVTIGYDLDPHMPHDLLLQAHLLTAIIHATSAGAFSLSIAYERGAAELSKAAFSDALTGLPNRRALEARFVGLTATVPCRGRGVALLDIDYFKTVNDRFGHAAGDDALRECGRIIQDNLGSLGILARIGGEEFAVLLPDVSLNQAHDVLERIRVAVASSTIPAGGTSVRLTLSAGLVHSAGGLDEFALALQKADASLYLAKNNGRNRIELAA